MDARSAQFQQQLQERDAEINRLQREQRVRDMHNDSAFVVVVFAVFFFDARVESVAARHSPLHGKTKLMAVVLNLYKIKSVQV